MGVVTFHYLIELVHDLMLDDLMGVLSVWGAWTLACVPILGGLVVGLMRGTKQDFGPGLSSLIAVAQGGAAQYSAPGIQPVKKMVAASVSLGSGASLGPEGPSVEIGANFGLLLGQVLQMSQERRRLLLGAGAAAGLAAGFNAPIAGVFFALEVVLGTTFATSAVSVVLLAAVDPGKLGLPRAALDGPASVAPPVAAIPATVPFKDPDPFQELHFPSVLAAKLAIADYFSWYTDSNRIRGNIFSYYRSCANYTSFPNRYPI